MAEITGSIPIQNFERCKHEIAFILNEEISNQVDFLWENIEVPVYVDREEPFDNSENIAINIFLEEGQYSEQTVLSSEGIYNFNIDIYVNSQSELFQSSAVIDTIYSWVRYILSHQAYVRLGFDYGIVMGTYVRGFIGQSKMLIKDADDFNVRRVNFECRLSEKQLCDDGVLLESNFTNFKICLTEKGYKVVTNL